ncbi:AsmA family protein [Sneathiella aquimaris]|uniref:hypothetical protein n=1 Tax=Sneathiella aquimaris TaxID=2599305 RepID=UPI00146D290B|nr:hypothetical protein [Sneathiella aquimaris]
MKRGLTIAMAAGLLIFCAAIVTVYVSIGSIIIDTIEEEGTALTQTEVTVQDAEFAPTTGTATLVQVKVANPAGYLGKNAFSIDRIDLWIDPETLNSDILHIKSMILVAPEINYEIATETDNLRTLKQYIDNSAPTGGTKKKLIVDNFYLKNGVVVVQANDLIGQRKTAKLEDIHLTGIGQAENGLTPAALASQILVPILRNTTLAALSTDLNLSDQARNIMNGALDETEKAFQAIRQLLNQ